MYVLFVFNVISALAWLVIGLFCCALCGMFGDIVIIYCAFDRLTVVVHHPPPVTAVLQCILFHLYPRFVPSTRREVSPIVVVIRLKICFVNLDFADWNVIAFRRRLLWLDLCSISDVTDIVCFSAGEYYASIIFSIWFRSFLYFICIVPQKLPLSSEYFVSQPTCLDFNSKSFYFWL